MLLRLVGVTNLTMSSIEGRELWVCGFVNNNDNNFNVDLHSETITDRFLLNLE